MQSTDEVDKNYRAAMVLQFAFMAAIPIYGVTIAVFSSRGWEEQVLNSDIPHVAILAAFSVISALLLLSRGLFAGRSARAAISKGKPPSEWLLAAQFTSVQFTSPIALFGLVYYMATADVNMSLPFLVVGLFALYRGRPNKEGWRAAAMREQR
ncbi:MAG: hypothetical protein O2884_12565 [Chloroflexi bacterium]|nr:hypothetical protein [Chloroflexota bacterium]